MSETLYNWLNTEVKLSKHISDIPSDFANGYFFGELLAKYHLLPTFKEFKNTMISIDITRNYSLLEKAFGDLSIQLTEVEKRKMVDKKKFKAEAFLFKIKQRIANKLISLDTLIPKGASQIKSIYKEMTNPTKFDKVNVDTLRRRNIQSAKLAPIKFNKLSLTQRDQKVITEIVNEDQYFNNQHMEEKNIIHHLESMHHDKQTRKDQTSKGNWENQMIEKRAFDSKMKEDYFSQTQFYRFATENSFLGSNKTNQLIVKDFDDNLSRLGLDLKTIAPKMMKGQTDTVATEIFMERVRQKIKEQEISKKDKEKRQRKISSAMTKSNAIRPNTTCVTKANETTSTHFRAGTARYPQMKTNPTLPPIIETTQADLEYIPLDVFNRERFFDNLDKENLKYRLIQTQTKEKKREHHTTIVKSIISAIIDLTEECYQYQLNNNTELVDLNEWKRLIQLFIENKSFHRDEPRKGNSYQLSGDKNMNEVIEDDKIEDQGNSAFSYSNVLPKVTLFTDNDHETFLNYIFLIGEFANMKLKEQIATLCFDINDVMGNDIGILIYEKHDYKPSTAMLEYSWKATEQYEPKNEDIQMLQMPTTNTNDTSFGDLMKEIIETATNMLTEFNNNNNNLGKEEDNAQIIKMPKENKDFKDKFNLIPLKISFIGNIFSGKKTQAKLIEEKYPGIKVYDIEKIISELKEKIEKIDSPIKNHPKFKTLKKNQIEQINKEKIKLEESIKDFIPFIRQILENGVNEEIRTNILMETIKTDFLVKDENDVINQIKLRNNRKNVIHEEIEKIKEEQIKKPKAKIKEEQQYKNELEKLTNESYKGFIVLDFPNNPEQARIIEFKINDYIQAIESGKTKNEKEEEELLKMCHRVIQPKQLSKKQSSMDEYIVLSTTKEEMIRRGENRKIDPQTKIIYHMTDYPPPEKDKKLNERLQLITEPNKDQMDILYDTYLTSFDEIMKFYLNFNITKKDISTDQLPKEDVNNQIKETLTDIITKYEDNLLSSEGNDKRLKLDSSLIHFNPNNQKTQQAKFFDLKMKFPSNLFSMLVIKWKEFTAGYECHCKNAFNIIKECQMEISRQLTRTEEGFINFLSEEREKKKIIQIFTSKYEAFIEQYNSLKKNELVVNDFNRDLNVLTDRLWELINEKKKQAIEEHKSIVSNSFVEEQINIVYSYLERLFILETEKLFVTIDILSEFFETKDSFNFTIKIAHEVLKNTSKYSLENNNSFPRLERMFKNCLVILFRYTLMFKQKEQIALQKHQIDISIGRKKIKKTNCRSGITPKQIENRELDDDIKETIIKHINIYKYKLCSLKFYTEKTLTKIRKTVDSLYSAMDNWIILSVKKQNETMNELIDNLRRKIGNSMFTFNDIELDDFRECYETVNLDITSDIDYLDNKTANEVFSLQVFFKANEVLKQYELSHNVITKYLFNEIFIKGYLLNDVHKKSFSKKLQHLNFHHFPNLQSHFLFLSNEINPNKLNSEGNNEEETNNIPEELLMTNALLTVILLMHCRKIKDYQGEEMLRENKDKVYRNCLMKKEDFLNIHFWFEDDDHFNEILTQLKEDEMKETEYDKLKEIKKCLFDINKMNEEEINFNSFIQLCLLNTITLTKRVNTCLQGIEKYEELFHIKYGDLEEGN